MNYLRERILMPIVIPLIAVVLIGFGALNLSRMFLAAGGTKAVAVAALVSIAIMVGAVVATTRDSINRGTLLATMGLFGVILSGAGLLAQEVDRDAHGAHGDEGEELVATGTIDITAVDINFLEKQVSAPGPNIGVNYVNEGQTLHTFVFEGFEEEMKLSVPGNGDVDSGVIAFSEPGEYVYYCDVPGHRAAGMEGVLTVEEFVEVPEAGEGGEAAGPADVVVPAVDIDFPVKEFEAAAGEVTFEYVNEGASLHTLVIEGREDEMKLEVASEGDTDRGSLALEAGTYVLYCDVPGHRAAGMEGTLTVT